MREITDTHMGRLVRLAVESLAVLPVEARLWAVERGTPETLHALVREKTTRCVTQNWASFEWYRDRCAEVGVFGEPAIGNKEALSLLPTTTKAMLRDFWAAYPDTRRTLRRILDTEATTGGSTGEPLTVTKSIDTVVWAEAAFRRGRRWAGIPTRGRGLHLKTIGQQSLLGRMRQRIMGFRALPAYPTRPEELSSALATIKAWRPDFITGYPTSLLALARAAAGAHLGPVTVWSTGEALLPGQREELAESFGGPVFQYYGSNEVSSIAYECNRQRLHIVEEHVVVETVGEDGAPVIGRPGRVLVTDLDNRAMPLLRYEIGDVAVLSEDPCPCGLPHATIESIEGRTQDSLRGRNGRELPAIFFASKFRNLSAISQYQLEQRQDGSVEIRWVGGNERGNVEASLIKQAVHEHLGACTPITVVQVESIPLTPRGKSRLVIGCGASSNSPRIPNTG